MMGTNLIHGQYLIDSFMKLLPPASGSKNSHYFSDRKGKIAIEEVSQSIKNKLSIIFQWQPPENDWALKLFNGITTMHNGDHSSADLAFIGLLAKHELSAYEADQVFRASGLYRSKWDELRGKQTYGERTISKVYNFRQSDDSQEYAFKKPTDPKQFTFASANN